MLGTTVFQVQLLLWILKFKTIIMIKNTLYLVAIMIVTLYSPKLLAQNQPNLESKPSYFEIRNTFYKMFDGELKKYYDSYEIVTDSDGNRWMHLTNENIDGLYNDTYSLALEFSKVINQMFFGFINYNRSVPMNQNELTSLLESYKIIGVKFDTKEYVFKFLWKELKWVK